jgi:hypothetical protein
MLYTFNWLSVGPRPELSKTCDELFSSVKAGNSVSIETHNKLPKECSGCRMNTTNAVQASSQVQLDSCFVHETACHQYSVFIHVLRLQLQTPL